MSARKARAPRLPKNWPTVGGRPATREEIEQWLAQGETHFNCPRYATDPHFCRYCTQPLEHEPCHICKAHRFEPRAAELRALLAQLPT